MSVLFQVDNITFDGGRRRLQCRKYDCRPNEPRRLAGYEVSVIRLNSFAKPTTPIKYKAKMPPNSQRGCGRQIKRDAARREGQVKH